MSELPPDQSSIAAAEAAAHESRSTQTFAVTSALGFAARRGTFRGASMTPARLKRASRQLEHLALRSLELADRVAAGEIAFLDAVDVAYEAALWSGLTNTVGDDIVQATLAAVLRMRGGRHEAPRPQRAATSTSASPAV
jgi:hypothetical protein